MVKEKRPPEIDEEILEAIRSGAVLPAEKLEKYPLPKQEIAGDTGINVLLDLAHHCYMGAMWGVAGALQKNGFRCVSSHACLDRVLRPGQLNLVRTYAGTLEDGRAIRPFIRWPAVRSNVVLTFQADGDAPEYTDAEIAALDEFVSAGGGLIMLVDINARGKAPAWGARERWPIRRLLRHFGADVAEGFGGWQGASMPTLAPADPAWSPSLLGEDGKSVLSLRRRWGRGRILAGASLFLVHHPLWTGDEPEPLRPLRKERLREWITWAAAGTAPVGGEPRLPDTHGGAGGIYPEFEKRFDGIHVLYAANQRPDVLELVENEYPRIRDRILAWLPSPLPKGEPLRILLAAGTGGGWAVNAFVPKENGIISYDLAGLVGIFGHEFAHILSGPLGAGGRVCANWFDGNQGEAHAGFFQGRILALYTDNKSMRDCNSILEYEERHGRIDLDRAAREGYSLYGGGGNVWRKLWYIWQKLDDRYGTTWYPRWRWVQHTRWENDCDRRLSVEEMVEDMSIAVGEDLFPFFRELGTTLSKARFPEAEFNGRRLTLPPAPLDAGPAGNARLEPIGDYTQPLRPG